jgi:P2 family phage contractile tail tube protein
MEITALIGARVWGPDGALIGLFESVTVPEVKNKKEESKPTDSIGTRRLPGISLEPMEAKFKASGFNPDFHAGAHNPFFDLGLQIRSNCVISRGQGKVEGKLAKFNIRGWFSDPKTGEYQQGTSAKPEYNFEVHAYELEYDGRMLIKIDIDNEIWEVDGVDVIESFRKNLGSA